MSDSPDHTDVEAVAHSNSATVIAGLGVGRVSGGGIDSVRFIDIPALNTQLWATHSTDTLCVSPYLPHPALMRPNPLCGEARVSGAVAANIVKLQAAVRAVEAAQAALRTECEAFMADESNVELTSWLCPSRAKQHASCPCERHPSFLVSDKACYASAHASASTSASASASSSASAHVSASAHGIASRAFLLQHDAALSKRAWHDKENRM